MVSSSSLIINCKKKKGGTKSISNVMILIEFTQIKMEMEMEMEIPMEWRTNCH